MNGKSHSGKQQGAAPSGSSGKNALILGVLGVAGLIVAIAVFNSGSPDRKKTDTTATSATEPVKNSGIEAKLDENKSKPTFGAANVPEAVPTDAPEPKKVVATIVSVATSTNEITAEQAKAFKDGLLELVKQGPASVPAIQDYLDKNLDSNYGDVKGADELGYNSLRHALLDTLKQIGGEAAQGAMLHVLQTTAEPNEVLELTNDLEQQAPGQYRDRILQAAKESLDLAGPDTERGPLFRVFQIYGASYAPPNAPAESAPAQAPAGQ
jgi:hypothetical protein